MDLPIWLRTWMARHPLKAPPDYDPAQYTAEVMATIRTTVTPRPARSLRPPWPWAVLASWPRPTLALAGALGLIVVLLIVQRVIPQRLLAGDTAPPPRQLAEDVSSDAEWIQQTLDLLEQFDEDVPVNNPSADDEKWLDDVDMLEELGSSSS